MDTSAASGDFGSTPWSVRIAFTDSSAWAWVSRSIVVVMRRPPPTRLLNRSAWVLPSASESLSSHSFTASTKWAAGYGTVSGGGAGGASSTGVSVAAERCSLVM